MKHLTVAVKHDGHSGKQIDASIHGLRLLEFNHSTLAVPSYEELFMFPWRRIVDTVVLFLLGVTLV